MSDLDTVREALTHAHVTLMRHGETSIYGSIITMGKSVVVDAPITAVTNGLDTRYGVAFMGGLTPPEQRFVVLHENMHKLLRHCTRHRDYWQEDAQCANYAADYVVNALILAIKDKSLCVMPKGGLYDAKYEGWSYAEVYRDLRQDKQNGGSGKGRGGNGGGKPIDEHDTSLADNMTAEEAEKLDREVTQIVHQAGILAGKMKSQVPRGITDSLKMDVDWVREMQDFVSAQSSAKDDDYTFRRFDRKYMAYDVIMPGTISETMGEVVVAIDTSGSIDEEALSKFANEISHLAALVNPECVRVLWWDTMVHGEQVFDDRHYGDIARLMRPKGGGGTRVQCVNNYIEAERLKPDCVVVLTDGHVESDFDWRIAAPTMWLVTDNKRFAPSVGRMVRMA
jgi:predicted metal-dependent peptidase